MESSSEECIPKEHIKGISEAAAELDVNVCFFLGTRTKDFFEDILGSKQKNSYDYQFNTIHDYSLIGGLDGLIINYGTLGIQLREVDPNEFARKYSYRSRGCAQLSLPDL